MAADLGRATKGAALSLKSRTLLYAASGLLNTPSWATGYAQPASGNADIKKYVDLVRGRVGVAMPALPAGLSQADMRERIRNERRIELAFEDHRAWDVRRWMQAPQCWAKNTWLPRWWLKVLRVMCGCQKGIGWTIWAKNTKAGKRSKWTYPSVFY